MLDGSQTVRSGIEGRLPVERSMVMSLRLVRVDKVGRDAHRRRLRINEEVENYILLLNNKPFRTKLRRTYSCSNPSECDSRPTLTQAEISFRDEANLLILAAHHKEAGMN